MHTPTPLLSLDKVDVNIAGVTVLRGLSWELLEGTHWGIVGPNGSGKSSLLGLVAGTLWPVPGAGVRRYTFGGRVQRDAVEARRRIAFVGPEFQDRYLKWDWNFSALDVVLSGVFRQDVPRKRAKPDELIRARATMREFGLGALADRPFLELSRGEQRRVLIARSMAFRPSILLLDEPAGSLDRRSRAVLDQLLARVGRDTTVVATAHATAELPSIVTAVLHLEAGCIVKRGARRTGAAGDSGSRAREHIGPGGAAPERSRHGGPDAAITRNRVASAARNASEPVGRKTAARDGRRTAARDGRKAAAGQREAVAPRSRKTAAVRGRTAPAPGARKALARDVSGAAGRGSPLIEIDHADVWLGNRRVLRDICWRLEPGEHWLVRGANGAGKSCFLKLVHARLRPALGGAIRWPGLGNPRNIWELRRQIGFVSAELHAVHRFPSTVHDCIASGFASSIGLTRPLAPGQAKTVAEMLKRFALEDHASRLLSTLSYGQIRRTLLARMLVNEPRVLLLDEPFEGLDEQSRDIVRAELGAFVAAGTQLVCASHHNDIRTRFTHELVVKRGRISAAGRIEGGRDSAAGRGPRRS